MPFIRRNFGPIGGQSTPIRSGSAETVPGVPQMWAYRTADAAAVVDTANYFAEVGGLVEVGDIIARVTIDGSGVPTSAGNHIVRTKSQLATGVWNVDVADANALAVTNTD
jgi:hypothetical protein